MAGLTTTGITIKSLDEVLEDIESAELANIDADLNLNPDDVLGQLNGVVAAAIAEVWELMEEVYQSAYPDTASGQSLSYIAALTGAIRGAATKATVTANLTGTSGITVPAGTRFYPDGDPDSLFETTASVVLTGGFATPTLRAVTAGSAATAVENETLIIATPVSGLDTAATPSGGSYVFLEGADEESDSSLRLRREQLLGLTGSSTVDGIRADMLTVTGVDSCTVFENPTGNIDANGVPPYAIEVLVYSSQAPSYDVDEVAAQIFASKPAGTETYGTETPVNVLDSSGNTHAIEYSEPTTQQLHVAVTLVKTADGTYVGDSAVADAIEEWAIRNLAVGQSVHSSDIVNIVADLEGVDYVNVLGAYVKDSDPPTSSYTWTATARELGTIAAADVDVTSS